MLIRRVWDVSGTKPPCDFTKDSGYYTLVWQSCINKVSLTNLMSRALIALLLVVSLVSGVFFFTPNNSAEYDEEFYEYQPYLQYEFHLHELDMRNYDENETYEFRYII